jgi:DNA transformation protein
VAGDLHRFDDLFQEFGRIAVRRMFGGEGIFADGEMIGLVFGDVIYLRTSESTRPLYLAEGCRPFSFEKPSQRRTVETAYYTLPDRLYDEPDELAQWARAALEAARTRKSAKKKTAKKKTKKSAA